MSLFHELKFSGTSRRIYLCVCVCVCTFVCMFLAILFLTQEREKENKLSPSYKPQCHVSSEHSDKNMISREVN